MLILPAIDILEGKCVRLTQGDYAQKTEYSDDPVAVAKGFADAGAQWIHIVDLDGAKAGCPVNLTVVERIAKETPAKIELGGGIRSLESARQILKSGIARVIFGTRIATDLEFVEHAFGELGNAAIAGVDARDGIVKVSGWTEGEDIELYAFLHQLDGLGVARFIVTDIATDGAMQGPNLSMLKRVCETVAGKVIASGGVSSVEDLRAIDGLRLPNLEGAIVGKAIYEGRIDLPNALQELGHQAL
ncbi:MAG: 1-(5-phosphoribosyl)-5-[(5-phosphoribosylamino)methylideneamino]imidazole-4-carboxamide isomerase [Fimbriimonadaceae bacterium]|nr:1-(5-phosphoribosyl)-5-[(5-phosphoribosylamino)methylideneamino]imidazole-4-carboxamide isomerase [Fimbriimonadaceae bacterium]